MKTLSMTSAVIAGFALAVASGSAEAGTKSFVLNGNELMSGTGYYFLGADLPGTSGNSFVFNIALPSDYKANTPVKIVLRMMTSDISCDNVFSVVATFRMRKGLPFSTAPMATSGLTFNTPSTFTVPSTSLVLFTKSLTLNGATGISITGQQAGDVIIPYIFRDGGSGADTCSGTTTVSSVKITYTTL